MVDPMILYCIVYYVISYVLYYMIAPPQSFLRSPQRSRGPRLGWDGAGFSTVPKLFTLLDFCMSSFRRGHANIICVVPMLADDPRRESRVFDCTGVPARSVWALKVGAHATYIMNKYRHACYKTI